MRSEPTTAVERLRHAYAHRREAAQRHQQSGGKVIAYLCDNVPIELIVAAGAFPLRVSPIPGRGLATAARLVDPLYPPEVSQRPDFVGSMLGRILEGDYDFVEAIIVPHNRNAVQAMHRWLNDARQEYDIAPPPTIYLDKAWSHHPGAEAYNIAAVTRLLKALEERLATVVDDAALRAAVEAVERARLAVRRISALRIGGGIAGSLAIELIGAFGCLAPADYACLVEQALDERSAETPAPQRKLYLSGSPQDTPHLYRLAEAQGATFVDEDHCWGSRIGDAPIATEGPLLRAIGERFHAIPACSVLLPFERVLEANTSRALRSGGEGVVMYVTEGDTAQLWETPEQLAAFNTAGLPTLHLARQPHDPRASDTLPQRLRDFLVMTDGD